jgi:hypothetical protein
MAKKANGSQSITIDPSRLEVVQREDGYFCLMYGDHALHTLPGHPVAHKTISLITHIRDELDSHGLICIENHSIVEPHYDSAYTILGVELEFIAAGKDLEFDFQRWLGADAILFPCAGPEYIDQMARWHMIDDFLRGIGLSRLALPPTELPPREYADRIRHDYATMFPAQRAAVLHLNCIHKGMLLLPMALVQGHCSSTEYANAALAAHAALSQVFPGATPSEHRRSFEALRGHADTALSYMRACGIAPSKERFMLGERIATDESRQTEFKEIKGANPVNIIKNTADEYVVAFLNSDGGRILWGVRNDDRVCVGVKLTYEQRDRLRRDVGSKLAQIKPTIDPSHYRIILHPVMDNGVVSEEIYVVEIVVPNVALAAPFYTGGNECFVRTDGGKEKMSGPALTDWIRRRLSGGSS